MPGAEAEVPPGVTLSASACRRCRSPKYDEEPFAIVLSSRITGHVWSLRGPDSGLSIVLSEELKQLAGCPSSLFRAVEVVCSDSSKSSVQGWLLQGPAEVLGVPVASGSVHGWHCPVCGNYVSAHFDLEHSSYTYFVRRSAVPVPSRCYVLGFPRGHLGLAVPVGRVEEFGAFMRPSDGFGFILNVEDEAVLPVDVLAEFPESIILDVPVLE